MELIRLAIMQLQDAKSFQKDLGKIGVELHLNHNAATCTRGCSITVEVLAYEKDLAIIKDIYIENYKKLAKGQDYDWNRLNAVYDPNQAMAICPACGHEFTTTHKECPDCGLMFG